MVLSLFSLSGPRKSEHPMSSVSFYYCRVLPASLPAHHDMDPGHNPNESLPGCLIKRECNNVPSLQCPIYYSEANNHLVYLLIAMRNFFPCVCARACVLCVCAFYEKCVCVRTRAHFMKIATDKIPHAGQMHVMVS